MGGAHGAAEPPQPVAPQVGGDLKSLVVVLLPMGTVWCCPRSCRTDGISEVLQDCFSLPKVVWQVREGTLNTLLFVPCGRAEHLNHVL